MSYYESVFIARQDVSAPQVESLADAFNAVIEENDGKVLKRESWGLRSLAYKIKKNRKGHYVLFNLDAPPGAVAEMERQMRLHEDILRYLTVKVEELEEGPSAAMRNKGGDDRPRRRGGDDHRSRRPDEDRDKKADAPAKEADAPSGNEDAPAKDKDSEAAEAPSDDAVAADDGDKT